MVTGAQNGARATGAAGEAISLRLTLRVVRITIFLFLIKKFSFFLTTVLFFKFKIKVKTISYMILYCPIYVTVVSGTGVIQHITHYLISNAFHL